jgi:phenylalanyl-tRNA synthetase alpha chain
VDPEALETEALSAIAAASSPTELEAVRVRILGRNAELPQALRGVREREAGIALNALRERLERALAERRAELERAELDRRLSEEVVDVTLPGEAVARGHLHLITQTRREVEDIFLGLGYRVVDGREVETTYYNFTALNLPAWHPARSPSASLYLDEDTVMRTETSPSQIRVMEAQQPPVYIVSLGRCYRRDTPDATHVPIFHQVEGLAVDRGISLADLKGTLLYLMRALFGEQREVRFRTHFFPFTEPSLEPDVSCFLCDGVGCAVCKHSGWIEMGGCGMVDPELYRHVGYEPDEVSGFAFGLGLERIAMLRHGLPDLRELWENDLRLLRQF